MSEPRDLGSAALRQRRLPLLALFAALSIANAAAVNVTLSAADTQRALAAAGGTDAARAQFHKPYIFAITGSMIHEIQVLTPFRRTVMAAEDALKRGDWAVAHGARALDGRSVADSVKPWERKVTLVANLQFDGLHTYVSVPRCEVILDGLPVLTSLDRRTTPLSSQPFSSRGTTTTSLVGAVIEADFDAEGVAQTSRSAVVICNGKDIARASIDFSRLE
jgi:hypothetical protein